MIMGEGEQANNIILIDYGYASKYLDEKGKHLQNEQVETFRGNLMFASLNQLNYESPCRKNDLLSLCYFMIYMLNGLQMPLYKFKTATDQEDIFEQFENQLKFKENTNFTKMINSLEKYSHGSWDTYASNLIEFCESINSMKFK